MRVREGDMDQLLGVRTIDLGERQEQPADYNQNEVTPYWMLAALFEEYELKHTDEFVDFGCGQGRIIFYVHYRFHVAVTGIEMNEQLYKKALENKESYLEKQKGIAPTDAIELKHCFAEEYEVKVTQNRFYFFNPFSARIFKKVVENILKSVEQQRREVDIILYYPSREYINYLETNTPFKQVQEVKIPGLYKINNKERFFDFPIRGLMIHGDGAVVSISKFYWNGIESRDYLMFLEGLVLII